MTTTLRAVVASIESGNEYIDKQRRVVLKFDGCSSGCDRLKVREDALGVAGLRLDDVVDVRVWPQKATGAIERALTPDLMGRVEGIVGADRQAERKGAW